MEAKKKYSWEYLDNCSYRRLQQIAKSLSLPCNFKKIYIKELILAKHDKTEKELKDRIDFLKLERKSTSARKKTALREKTSEKSNLKVQEETKTVQSQPKEQEKVVLSPSITYTPKRPCVARRSSPRFQNSIIRYKPKTLCRSISPKTYSSPRNKKVLKKSRNEQYNDKIKTEQYNDKIKTEQYNDKIKTEQNNENIEIEEINEMLKYDQINDRIEIFNYISNKDETPIALQKEVNPVEEDFVNIYEVIPPPIKFKTTNTIYPSTSQESYYEKHLKNVSEIRELVASQPIEDYSIDNPIINDNTSGFMDRINNYVNSSTEQLDELKNDSIVQANTNKSLPKFADAFVNCKLPWIGMLQEHEQENNPVKIENPQEAVLDFPDKFGFQNIYNYTEDSQAMQQLESYLDSPVDDVGALNMSELVDQVLGQVDRNSETQSLMKNFESVQCVVCSRTGTKTMLEQHIKKKHSSKIHKDVGGEWMLKYSLGHLTCLQIWCSEVLERGSLLYILSVKYTDPEYCMATLSILSKPTIKKYGSITLYNSLTGEPHTWEGQIQPFSTNLPYYNENVGLNIELDKLHLLPNSANLKLINRELVNSSLSKVIVGQPELNNIYLMFFISIW